MPQLRAPVNPEVVKWAAEDSGMTSIELAARLKRPLDEFQGWLTGESQPTQAQLRNFCRDCPSSISNFLLVCATASCECATKSTGGAGTW